MAVIPVCDGVITQSKSIECLGTLRFIDLASLAPAFNPSSVDPTILLSHFVQGFVIVTTFWGLGRGISAILTLIRR